LEYKPYSSFKIGDIVVNRNLYGHYQIFRKVRKSSWLDQDGEYGIALSWAARPEHVGNQISINSGPKSRLISPLERLLFVEGK
jgi:hypothetical protein